FRFGMSTMTHNAKSIRAHASENTVLKAFGDELTIELSGQQTNGRLTLWSNVTPPAGGPPLHYHLYEDELYIVQEGRVSFTVNGDHIEGGPGTVVFAPRGSVHTFRNTGCFPSRMLVSTQPSGFETFFARCAEEFQRPGGPDNERIVAIS